MRIDELTRDLQAQADQAVATAPHVGMADLRARRTRARRRSAATGAAAGVLLAVTGVVWLGGTTPGDGTITPGPADSPHASPTPTPTSAPTPPDDASPGWQPVACENPTSHGCDLPTTLTYAGRTYTRFGGVDGTQPVFAGNGVNRELGLSVVPRGGPTLVLVGAARTGPGSRLVVSVNWARSEALPGDELNAWVLPAAPDSQKVVVSEVGDPAQGEVLQIATYSPEG